MFRGDLSESVQTETWRSETHMYDTESIKSTVKNRLTEKRYLHTLAVADYAEKIALHIGYDVNRAKTAALLHDIARELSDRELLEYADKFKVRLTEFNKKFRPSIHGKIGAAMAKQDFNIDDNEILLAIENHVTGRPGMTVLEEIIYLADHIDKAMNVHPEYLEKLKGHTLDEAVALLLSAIDNYEMEKGKDVDERTEQTFDWLIGKTTHIHAPPDERLSQVMREFDKLFDDLIATHLKHRINLKGVKNARELGGYETVDGRTIKKGCLLRSGELSSTTPEELEKLRESGISHIIDLRTETECAGKPDVKIPGITYVHAPIVRTVSSPYLESIEKWYNETSDGTEKTWLFLEYLSSFDIKGIYICIIRESYSHSNIRKIFELLLREECTGVLFHCTSGKDRTGIISEILLHVLGVKPESVEQDYYSSVVPFYIATADIISKAIGERRDVKLMQNIMQLMCLEKSIPEYFFNELIKTYGSAENFLLEALAFTTEKIEKLKEKWLQ